MVKKTLLVWLNSGSWDGEIMLVYFGESSCNHKDPYKKKPRGLEWETVCDIRSRGHKDTGPQVMQQSLEDGNWQENDLLQESPEERQAFPLSFRLYIPKQ